MPQDYHKTLEECANKAKELESEITKFKSSIELNESIAENLTSVSSALIQVTKQVRPITDVKFRRFTLVIIGICVASLLISALTLALLLIRG
jgi:hypothetical protein